MTRTDDLTKRFGRNIGESIGATYPKASPDENATVQPAGGRTVNPAQFQGRRLLREAAEIELARIMPDPEQPRREFDSEALTDLTDSIRQHGVLQPIRVRWSGQNQKWIIIAGERRFLACNAAGLQRIPCIAIDEKLADEQILIQQMIENSQRENLRPVEQALAYRRLADLTGWSHRELGEAVSVSKSQITKSLALLDLPDDVKQQIDGGEIPRTAGYQLARLSDDKQIRGVASAIVDEGMTRDEAERIVRGKSTTPNEKPPRRETTRSFRTRGGSLVVTVYAAAATNEHFASLLREVLAGELA